MNVIAEAIIFKSSIIINLCNVMFAYYVICLLITDIEITNKFTNKNKMSDSSAPAFTSTRTKMTID